MHLSPAAHERLEKFLGEHLEEPGLRLPRIRLHSGRVARLLTDALRIGAMTVGRHIFIAPRLLVRGEDGRLAAPGWLIAHEATHVVQFNREGFARFLYKYLRGYLGALRRCGSWDAAARMAAYLAIAEECAAREAEHAYRKWTET
jgi:hypothetical protein